MESCPKCMLSLTCLVCVVGLHSLQCMVGSVLWHRSWAGRPITARNGFSCGERTGEGAGVGL